MSNMSSQKGEAGGPGKMSRSAGGPNKPTSMSAAPTSDPFSASVGQVADEIKQQGGSVAESAKGLASHAGEKLLSSVEEQKAAGADFVGGMAGAMRRAANEFGDLPQAAQYIRYAADQIDSVSNALKRRDVNQLVSDVQEFARRQPTAFLGAAVLAGFAVARFLKTSTTSGSVGSQSYARQGFATGSQSEGQPAGSAAPNWSPPSM
jgi:hypothetical protein